MRTMVHFKNQVFRIQHQEFFQIIEKKNDKLMVSIPGFNKKYAGNEYICLLIQLFQCSVNNGKE